MHSEQISRKVTEEESVLYSEASESYIGFRADSEKHFEPNYDRVSPPKPEARSTVDSSIGLHLSPGFTKDAPFGLNSKETND